MGIDLTVFMLILKEVFILKPVEFKIPVSEIFVLCQTHYSLPMLIDAYATVFRTCLPNRQYK